MRKMALLSAFCVSSVLLSGRVQARMGTDKKHTPHKDMASSVDFQTFDLDGQVHDLMWCGFNDEVVLMHTTEGTIYRSRDRGQNWKRLRSLLHKHGANVADEDQEVSEHRLLFSDLKMIFATFVTRLDTYTEWFRAQPTTN